MIRGSQAVVESLLEEGIDTIFGLPGGAVLDLYDAIYDSPLRHVLMRHEQGAAHAADGYARATGKVGVCISTSGPGATNLVTGLATANMDSVPLVALTGNVPVSMLGLDAFQEADIFGATQSITKHNYLVREVQELPQILKNAFSIARTGKPGPVLVDIPRDIFTSGLEFSYPTTPSLPGYRGTAPAPSGIRAAARAILSSKRPVLYVGGGVVSPGAVQALRELAQLARIPVTTTLMALGSFPHDHPLYLGMPGMHGTYAANAALSETDCLIAAGARFDDRVTGKVEEFARRASIIHINVDPAEVGKIKEAEFPLVADAEIGLGALAGALKEYLAASEPSCTGMREEWTQRVARWRRENPLRYSKQPGCLVPQEVIEKISQAAPSWATVVTGVGQHQMWTAMYYRFSYPRRFITSGGLGTMGFGLPAAIGAQVARPGETVVLIDGDGSFQMTLQELAVVAHERLPLKMFIINNRSYGMVRQWQEMFFGSRFSHSHLPQLPSFVKLAQAYDIPGRQVSEPGDLPRAVDWALSSDGPVLLDCLVRREEMVLPMVPPGAALKGLIQDIAVKDLDKA